MKRNTNPKAAKGCYLVLGIEEKHNYNKGTVVDITRGQRTVTSFVKGIRMANQLKKELDTITDIYLINDEGRTLLSWRWVTTLDGEWAYWKRFDRMIDHLEAK